MYDVVLQNQGVMYYESGTQRAWPRVGWSMTWRLNVISLQCGER